MVHSIRVGDVMTKRVVTIPPESDLIECARTLIKKRVGSLVLIDKNRKIKGILTLRDLAWAFTKKSKKDLKDIKAKEIASKKVKTIKPNLELNKALARLKKLKFKRLPVIYKGNLVGILTIKDILRIEPSLYHSLSDFMRIKEEEEKLRRRELLAEGTKWDKEGVCEECGNFGLLTKVDGCLVCESCREIM